MPNILAPDSLSNNFKVAFGVHTTVTAADEIATGLNTIIAACATAKDNPSDDFTLLSCTFSGGTLTVKSWKNTSGSDPTPAAATTLGKAVNWIAVGY